MMTEAALWFGVGPERTVKRISALTGWSLEGRFLTPYFATGTVLL